jgi:pantetheine-phosphate adenylyltransferase
VKIPVYAGSFDPITKGHLSVVRRSVETFGECIVLIAVNPDKHGTFSIHQRLNLIRMSLAEERIDNAFAYYTEGYVADWCDKGNVLVRGIREASELKYEQGIADFNRARTGIETVFIPALPEQSSLSSSKVREMAAGIDANKDWCMCGEHHNAHALGFHNHVFTAMADTSMLEPYVTRCVANALVSL